VLDSLSRLVENVYRLNDLKFALFFRCFACQLDVKNELFGKKSCYSHSGTKKIKYNPVDLAKKAEIYEDDE
jgi:hypothetical protein